MVLKMEVFTEKAEVVQLNNFENMTGGDFQKKDIDTGHDHGQGDPHVHDWVNGKRQIGRPPTIGELKKIKFKSKEQK